MGVSEFSVMCIHLCQKTIMKNTNHSELVCTMDKQALRVYGTLSLIVYLSALGYCYFTNHFMEMGIIGAVMLGLAILIFSLYFSTDKQSKTNTHDTDSESSLRHRSVGVYHGAH